MRIESSSRVAATIEAAIAGRRLLRFEYGGFMREVEPHTYGVDKLSQRSLCAYQRRGGSSTGAESGWKTFHERDIGNIDILDGSFRAREEYRRNDPAFAAIVAQV
jgi:hypothetical protein